LRYFASKPGSSLAAGKPLMAIPIDAIKNVERVYYELQLKKTDKKGKDLVKNTFEIFLKEDFLDIFLRSDYEMLFLRDNKRKTQGLKMISKDKEN
jgi:hypothetical protein